VRVPADDHGSQASVAVEVDESAVIARIAGEIDISNVRSIESTIIDAMAEGARLLVLDLTEVRYLDSSSIAMVCAFDSQMTMKRKQLRVIAPTGSRVRRVFFFAGVHDALDLHDDADSALGRSVDRSSNWSG
jgi:anti-sigma B factor antagonist